MTKYFMNLIKTITVYMRHLYNFNVEGLALYDQKGFSLNFHEVILLSKYGNIKVYTRLHV